MNLKVHNVSYRRPSLFVLRAAASGAVFLCLAQSLAIAGPVEDVERVWLRRQALVATARFVWLTTRTDTKGAYTSAVRQVDPTIVAFPPQDTTYTIREEIAFDKTRGRLTTNGKSWDFSNKILISRDDVRVLGADSLATLSDAIEGVRGTQGAIYRREHPFVGLTAQPVTYCLRPFVPTLGGLRVGSLRLEENADTDRKAGVVLLNDRGMRCQVDPSRDYVVVKVTGTRPSGEPRFQLDIDYGSDQTVGWIPRAWRLLEYGDSGHTRLAMSSEVVEYSLNTELPDDLFTITFPEGARVFDETKGINYVVGSAGAPAAVGSRRVPITYIIVGMILLAIIIIARRQRRRRVMI